MIDKLFRYYNTEYKVEWIKSDISKSSNQNVYLGEYNSIIIYFNKNNKEHAIVVDAEKILVLKKKKTFLLNGTSWRGINHIHLEDYDYDYEKIIGIINSYLK